jgi:hypothetical protein
MHYQKRCGIVVDGSDHGGAMRSLSGVGGIASRDVMNNVPDGDNDRIRRGDDGFGGRDIRDAWGGWL